MIRRWSLPLLLLLAAPALASAQALEDYDYENLSFRGFGLDVGYIWPNRVEPTFAYALRADLGYLGPSLRIVPSISYWTSTLDADELTRIAAQLSRLDALQQDGVVITAADLGEIDWSDVSIGFDAQYAWQPAARLLAYAGAGTALHVFNGNGQSVDGTFMEDLLDTITAGISTMAGLEFAPVEALRLYGEGRFTLMDNVRYPEVRVGASFALPLTGPAGAAR